MEICIRALGLDTRGSRTSYYFTSEDAFRDFLVRFDRGLPPLHGDKHNHNCIDTPICKVEQKHRIRNCGGLVLNWRIIKANSGAHIGVRAHSHVRIVVVSHQLHVAEGAAYAKLQVAAAADIRIYLCGKP